jgi:hypothetical protein
MTEINGSTSDGFHTFDELYHHRAVLTAMLCCLTPGQDWWRSKQHADGSMFDGFFIVGADSDYGQATYHYPLRYWDMFDAADTLDRAPVWDGHTHLDTLERLWQSVTGLPLEVKP